MLVAFWGIVTLLHVTCYIKRFAIREKGEKKLVKE
mgnify:CR=1 FL=1